MTKFIEEKIEFYKKVNDSLTAKKIMKAYFRLSETLHQFIDISKVINKKTKKNKEHIVEVIEELKKDLPIDKAL